MTADTARKLAAPVPSYRRHATGQAVVKLSGQDHYLGKHGTEESYLAYARALAAWEARGRTRVIKQARFTIATLVEAYRAHAKQYYVRNGRPTSRQSIVRASTEVLVEMHGDLAVADFGPVKLAAVQATLADRGLARNTVNYYCDMIRGMFKWACSKELVTAEQLGRLRSLDGLRRGRTTARETPRITPVDQADLDAAMAFLDLGGRNGGRRRIAAMVRTQLLTGMRPGEVCGMRPGDIDRTQPVWIYRVSDEVNKTEHLDRDRAVAIGPRAQAVLAPWLERATAPTAPVFPTQSGKQFLVKNYRAVLQKNLAAAGLKMWSPNQLRHNWATQVRARYGLDAARSGLGHSDVSMTEIYAERDLETARRVASEIG